LYAPAMRRALVPVVAVLLASAFAPSARAALPSLGGEYGVKTSVERAGFYDSAEDFVDLGYPSTEIIWIGGCRSGEEEVDLESDDACDLAFSVKFKGRTILDEEFDGSALGDYSDSDDEGSTYFRYERDWSSCKRSGRYQWTLTASRSSIDDAGAEVSEERSKRGSFRIPKCTTPKTRKVSAGAAASFLNDELGERYEGEFVSQVRCGSGRRSTFRCAVRRNNNYRQCAQSVTVRALKTDRFGRKDNTFSTSYGKPRCSSY